MSFLIIQNEKNVFLGYKNIKFKSGKIDILPKGLTHCFGPKMAIFPFFFFGIIDQENVFYDILQRKIAFLGYKNIKFKMAIFPTFFLGNIGQQNVFYHILDQKNAFLGYKNIKFQKTKNWHFSKRVNPWFCSKMTIFPTFFFQAIQPNKMTFMTFQNEKTPFQAIKTRSSKTRKIDIFPKGLTHGFGRKMVIFPTCFFRQYSLGKCLL